MSELANRIARRWCSETRQGADLEIAVANLAALIDKELAATSAYQAGLERGAAECREIEKRIVERTDDSEDYRAAKVLAVRACISRILALVTTPQPALVEGWRDIATAPKDDDWHMVARFKDGVLLWWERARWSRKRSQWRSHGGPCEPTHYLPLPAPPISTKENGK